MFSTVRMRAAGIAVFLQCWCLLTTGAAVAQTPAGPTPEQMEIFRSLTPEQQQAILESLNGGSSTGGLGTNDANLKTPETVVPRATATNVPGTTAAGPTRIRGGDTVIVQASLPPPAEGAPKPTLAQADIASRFLDRLNRGNPYKLDASGTLLLSGVAPIALAGLTEDQATLRLSSDPALTAFVLKLKLLPLEKKDEEALQPFGYDLFAGAPTTFAPVTDIPVPSEYVIGPGDRFEVQLIGKTKARHSLVVNREGNLNFPDLGPIPVSGLRFEAAKSRIEARVADQMIGTQAVVSLGDLRSIRVFVLGEAAQPGSYTVSGLATITNALFASGGVKTIGSLRNVQLKRRGKLVTRLDLYDLLLRGDTSHDVKLLPGDVIFIPPVGATVGVVGEIRRPAIYELKQESTAADLIELGGGLSPSADQNLAHLEHINDRRERVVVDIDLSNPQARSRVLRNGDLLRIPAIRETFEDSVALIGNVYRAGQFQYRSGLRLTDVLPSISELKPNSDQHYILIRREEPGTKHITVHSADLQRALQQPHGPNDPGLAPRDTVVVFDIDAGRDQYMTPVLEQMRRQATRTEPAAIVRVSGKVVAPGDYPLEPGMTVADLIRAGGGLLENAYGGSGELARYEVLDGETRTTTIAEVNVQDALAGNPSANLKLSPSDLLVVKEISEWSRQETVRLEGEVKFPGEYPIERGETLRHVIDRAGGLTSLAFSEGSVFTRESLRIREQEQLKVLSERMKQDLGALALQVAGSQAVQGGNIKGSPTETLAIGQALLSELENTHAVGRLVIDLPRVMRAQEGSSDDLLLRDGDRLVVPRRSQEVTILGEVQNSTSMLYDPSLSREDYIQQSGGVTRRADEKNIYVVRANGSVDARSGSAWFGSSKEDMRPGDTIVVPLDAERMQPLPFWTAVTTIMYNIAVAVAAVNSF